MGVLCDLFKEARSYGRVNLFTNDNGTYSCTIRFNSIVHSELKALSKFDHQTPEEAILAALTVAKEIVKSLSNLNEQLKLK